MNGPVPTRLVFIHELSSLPLHTKVRFLGWYVYTYTRKCIRLVIEDQCGKLRYQAREARTRAQLSTIAR